MSQYLLRISSWHGPAPGLFGPFVVDDEVVWSGDITLNYNAEVGYLERKDPRRMTFPGAVPAKAILYIYIS